MKYVSLLNPPFSGSTLVSMLLCSQPRVMGFGDTYVVPDPRHYPKHPCTCGLWYDKCPPRVAIRDEIRAGGIPDFDWDRAAPAPIPQLLPAKLRRIWPMPKSASLPIVRKIPRELRKSLFRRFYLENQLMIQALASSEKYDCYFDGCKNLVRLELLRSMIPDIKILHVVRHPGAFLYHFHKLGEAQYTRRLRHWIRYNQHAHNFSHLVPAENYLAVTYEFIVRQPEQFVDQMVKFLEITETHATGVSQIRKSQIHITGNRMRESVDQVLDYSNTWRGKMPADVEESADQAVRNDPWLRSIYDLDRSISSQQAP